VTARRNKKARSDKKWSSDDNQWFEALALDTIERGPTPAWGSAVALWRLLPSAWPSTRDRILRRMLEEAAKRGEPWPARLVKRFAEAAKPAFTDTQARARVHDREGLQMAARYVAHHLQASWGEIAKAAGTTKENVRQWRKRPDFAKYVNDEEYLINHTNTALGLSEKHRLDEKAARLDIASWRLQRQRKRIAAARRQMKRAKTAAPAIRRPVRP
jgi:hypothetical protein